MGHLSISQIKKFMKSPSSRAGEYILGVKDEFDGNDAMTIGTAFHKYVQSGDMDASIILLEKLQDKDKGMEQFRNLIEHYQRMDLGIKREGSEVPITFNMFGFPVIGFIDMLGEDTVYELKSASSLSKKDDSPAMRQSQNNREEYKLQCRAYMKATGKKKAMIIEVLKKKFKTKSDFGQVIEFEMTDELEKEMEEKYKPIVNKMVGLLFAFGKKLDGYEEK